MGNALVNVVYGVTGNKMDNTQISSLFEEFMKNYDIQKNNQIWDLKSKEFRSFWDERIMKDSEKELNDEEIDRIVRILDKNGKGNTKDDISVARVMIPQGAWRRMFKEIKKNSKLKEIINKILNEADETKLSNEIDELYSINLSKNNLTGRSANAINTLLFAYNPLNVVSIVSLNDRERIIEYFGFEGVDLEKDSQGNKVVLSNRLIINGFKKILDREFTPRILSEFLYLKIKDYWKESSEEDEEDNEIEISEKKVGQFEEKIYQKLIHRNFKLLLQELDYYDPESQNDKDGHYYTEAGTMDFFCKDSKGDFVVIELKKESSDVTIGQICRYMGWVKENLCNDNQKVRGLIISENIDPLIDYSLRIVPNVSFKRMKLNVKIEDWK